MTVRVKLCGITRLEDALRAAEMGVDALGFNFVQGSPRRIAPEQARAIAAELPPFVVRVGIFADERPSVMEATAALVGLHFLQLHGKETPAACASLTIPWYKAHRVTPDFRPEEVGRFPSGTFLLDADRPGKKGGTGGTFDWGIARRAAAFGRVIVAGGLTPANVGEAIALARPYAVDVNSGVESAPGWKDAALMREFMRRVVAATTTQEGAP